MAHFLLSLCLSLLLLLLLLLLLSGSVTSLTTGEAARQQLTRSRLAEALSSPSGKLTLSPEIIIPEPVSPTAILLQNSAVTQLSESLRTKAKANTAFVSSTSTSSLRTFCVEQEQARGNFPGPVPVIYCQRTNDGEDNVDVAELAEIGVSGIVVSTKATATSDKSVLDIDGEFQSECTKALTCGLQPVPEVIVEDVVAASWHDDETIMEQVVDTIAGVLGGQDPVSILISIVPTASSDNDDNDGRGKDTTSEEQKNDHVPLPLPAISRALKKRVPIMGSIRTMAGENRLGEETARYKAAGFTGAVLRRECVPNYQAGPSLEYISDFWAACVGDLKSTRSKTFNFRSKNNMEKSVSVEWAKYQKSVIESGALGEAEDTMPPGFNADAGDYKGF
jgi:hypothetical protein